MLGALLTPLHAAAEGAAEISSGIGLDSNEKTADLIAKFKAANWSKYAPPTMQEITSAIAASPALRDEVLKGFHEAADNVQRNHFCRLLRAASIPDFPAQAFSWARDSKNIKTRLSSFTFLAEEQQTPEIEELFFNAFMNEKDTQVLGQVLNLGLRRSQFPAPELVNSVVARLHTFTLHEGAEIRMGSIQRLAEWDKALRHFPADQARLLGDPVANVRIAAIGATSLSNYSSDHLKESLLRIFGNSDEPFNVRHVAYLNLDHFDLTVAEKSSLDTAFADLRKIAAASRVPTE